MLAVSKYSRMDVKIYKIYFVHLSLIRIFAGKNFDYDKTDIYQKY